MLILRAIILLSIFAVLGTSTSVNPAIAQDNPGTGQRLTVELVLPPKSIEPNTFISQIEGVIKNNFFQNLVIVLITALVTGLAVPRIKANMDLRYFREQKKHEAELARQAKIIEQQTEFLKEFTDVIWRFHFATVKVTYELASGVTPSNFKPIWDEYTKESWVILQDCRRSVSNSVHLVKSSYYEHLLELYKEFVNKDVELTTKVEGKTEILMVEWLNYHREIFFVFSAQLDNEIVLLAREMGLSAGVPSNGSSTNILKADVSPIRPRTSVPDGTEQPTYIRGDANRVSIG